MSTISNSILHWQWRMTHAKSISKSLILKVKTYQIMNNSYLTDINSYAVFVAWIIHTATRLLWFQPKLFGKEWSMLTGKVLNPAKNWIIPGFAGHLEMIFVFVIIIKLANINNGPEGLLIGLLCWIGFVVSMEIGNSSVKKYLSDYS
jgi:hypothetical protein